MKSCRPLLIANSSRLHCYGERLVVLEAFRDFVRDRLLQNTDRYVGLNEFNRHGILHGIFENFGQASTSFA